jgi:hypothetical protein
MEIFGPFFPKKGDVIEDIHDILQEEVVLRSCGSAILGLGCGGTVIHSCLRLREVLGKGNERR